MYIVYKVTKFGGYLEKRGISYSKYLNGVTIKKNNNNLMNNYKPYINIFSHFYKIYFLTRLLLSE